MVSRQQRPQGVTFIFVQISSNACWPTSNPQAIDPDFIACIGKNAQLGVILICIRRKFMLEKSHFMCGRRASASLVGLLLLYRIWFRQLM